MAMDELLSGESKNVEYKQEVPGNSSNYLKTVVAFANGEGGKLIFGIEDGTMKVIGFAKDEVFQRMDAITNAIYDSCEPKITPNVAVQEIDGRAIIVVEILAGMQRPYYIKSLGITEGTFVRVSGTTRRAERYMLQELILDGTNRSYDQLECEETVSEEQIAGFCDRLYQHALELYNMDAAKSQIQKVGKNQLLSWKLLAEKDGKYHSTNGYLLLDGRTDKFPEATIQCAVFKGTVRDIFITRKEFTGSIYQQIEDAYNFVLQHINLGSRIEGLYRQDIYELPIRTIREMIANAVCHRSYLTPGKIQVALFDDRLEVTSPGMLDNEITIEKMKTGLSKIRNKGIAAAFSYINVIEAWGSGIPRMFRETKEYGLREPELVDMGNDFRINLYRRELDVDQYGVVSPITQVTQATTQDVTQATQVTQDTSQATTQVTQGSARISQVPFTDEIKSVLALIHGKPTITQKEIAMELGWNVDRVKYYFNKMKKHRIIKRVGNSQTGRWEILTEDGVLQK